jgi:hypothetical protein
MAMSMVFITSARASKVALMAVRVCVSEIAALPA